MVVRAFVGANSDPEAAVPLTRRSSLPNLAALARASYALLSLCYLLHVCCSRCSRTLVGALFPGLATVPYAFSLRHTRLCRVPVVSRRALSVLPW